MLSRVVLFIFLLALSQPLLQCLAFNQLGNRLRSSSALRSSPWNDPGSIAGAQAAAAAAAQSALRGLLREWYDFKGCQVLLPNEKVPRAIIHFVGGFVAGAAAPIAYASLLAALADEGYMVVNTPIPAFDLKHGDTAAAIGSTFAACYFDSLLPLIGVQIGTSVPIIGLSHSLGGKLTSLLSSRKQDRKTTPRRFANVFMAFNNYGLLQSAAMGGQQVEAMGQVKRVVDTFRSPEVQELLSRARESSFLKDAMSGAMGVTGGGGSAAAAAAAASAASAASAAALVAA